LFGKGTHFLAALSPMIWIIGKHARHRWGVISHRCNDSYAGNSWERAFGSVIGDMRGTKRSVPVPCGTVEKNMNRPIGVSRWNGLVGNLGKFTDSLNACLSDYALLSCN
jgi:hypothetical protein